MTRSSLRLPLRGARQFPALAACSAVALLALAPVADARKVIVGSPGPDRLVAKSAGGDTLFGGGGPDRLVGGRGHDRLYGVRSDNHITGGGGNDYIEGGAGSDKIDGGAGNNTIYGSSGHDVIRAGDGNNYVDVGGAPDTLTLGGGNNVVVTGSGGLEVTLGSGNNVVYHGTGALNLTAGGGVNKIYIGDNSRLSMRVRSMKINCGPNPASAIVVPASALEPDPQRVASIQQSWKPERAAQWIAETRANMMREFASAGCPRVETYEPAGVERGQQIAEGGTLTGTDADDKLLGGHGDVVIDAKGGNNEIWVDRLEDDPGKGQKAVARAGDGNNRIFGGRGTNTITAGNGNNFVRGGAHVNRITLGSGKNVVRLQGPQSTNTVVFNGRRGKAVNYVEAFGNAKRTRITCKRGAKAVIIHGVGKPKSNCGAVHSAYSKMGQRLQVKHTPPIDGSVPIMAGQVQPGQGGVGVRRP